MENERQKCGQPRGILMTSVGCSKRHLTIKRAATSDAENSNLLGGGGSSLSIGTGFARIYVEIPRPKDERDDRGKKNDGASGAARRVMTPDADQPGENVEKRFGRLVDLRRALCQVGINFSSGRRLHFKLGGYPLGEEAGENAGKGEPRLRKWERGKNKDARYSSALRALEAEICRSSLRHLFESQCVMDPILTHCRHGLFSATLVI